MKSDDEKDEKHNVNPGTWCDPDACFICFSAGIDQGVSKRPKYKLR